MDTTLQICNWMWWRNKKSILFIVSVVISVQLVYWLGQFAFAISPSAVQVMVFSSVSITILTSLAIFTFGADLDFSSGRTAFPQRFFALPIGSLKISMIPVIAMVLAIAWCWLPAAAVSLHSLSKIANNFDLDTQYIVLFLTLPWLVVSAIGCWLQAAAWWPFRSAWQRLLVIAIFVVLVVAISVYGFDCLQTENYQTPQMIIVVSAIFGFATAVLSVFRARRLSWRSEASVRGSSRIATLVANPDSTEFQKLDSFKQLNFESANDAILWRDWRQVFRVPSILMWVFATPFALVVFLVPLLAHEYSSNPIARNDNDSFSMFLDVLLDMLTVLTPLILLVPPVILLMISPALGKSSYWNREFAISAFLGGLPVSDEQLLRSRFKSVLRSSFQAWLAAFFVIALWALPYSIRQPLSEAAFASGKNEVWPFYLICFVFGSLYLTMVAPWPGMALGLFGRGKLGTTFTFVFLILFVIGASVCYSCAQAVAEQVGADFDQFVVDWWPTILIFCLVIKLFLASWTFLILKKRNLIAWNQIVRRGALLLFVCASITSCLVFLLWQTDLFSRDSLLNMAMLIALLFPCWALLFARLAVDANRHR